MLFLSSYEMDGAFFVSLSRFSLSMHFLYESNRQFHAMQKKIAQCAQLTEYFKCLLLLAAEVLIRF